MLRPSTARGMPALGMAASGRVVAGRMASTAVRTVVGPVEQLTPMALAPHSVSRAAACWGEEPSRQLFSSSTVTMTSTGKFGATARAASDLNPDGACAPLSKQGSGLLGRGAVEAVVLVVYRDHDQHRQIRRDSACSFKSYSGFVERGHGFDDKQVDAASWAAFCQNANLLGKGGAGFVEAGFAEGFQAHTERANRTSDPGLASLLVLKILDGLTRKANPGGVDFFHFPGQAMPGEADAVGSEGVGFDNLSPGLQVLFVNREDQTWVREIECGVAAVDEDPAGVEHGTHGAVGEQGAICEDLGKLGHSLVMLRHASQPRQRSGLLCYTSGVISWAATGSGTAKFAVCGMDLKPCSKLYRAHWPLKRHRTRLVPRIRLR